MKIRKIIALVLTGIMLGSVSCGPRMTENPDETSNSTRITAPGASTDMETEITSAVFDTPTAGPVTAPVTTSAQPSNGESRVSFLAAGDNIIHEKVFTDAKNRAKSGEKYNFIDMYADVADFIASADLAFVNQETPLGGDELGISGYPNFNGPQAAGEALAELGFDIVNIATNHMLDKGVKGLKGSIDFWNSQPVTLLGGYADKDDYENIRVVEKNNIKISFISYTYSVNDMAVPADGKPYIPFIDQKEIVSMIGKAQKISDVVIVVMHWGVDGSFNVTAEQKTLAKAFAAAGADVVLGMHSHTIQPMEWIANSDGSRTLVIYSLGNFISTQYDAYNLVGGIVTFDIKKDKSGDCSIENPIFNPCVTQYDTDRLNLQVYLLEDYTDALAAAHGTIYYGDTKVFTVDLAKKYAQKQLDAEFLPDYLK